MAQLKISDLPVGTSLTGSEEFEIIQLGTNKRISLSELQSIILPAEVLTLNPDVATGTEDTILTGNVLSNDVALQGSPSVSQYSIAGVGGTFTAGQTANVSGWGTFVLMAGGGWTLTPQLNRNGVFPTVTYQATNGSVLKQSTLNITLNPANDAPVTFGDVINTTFNTPITFNPLINDTDPDGDTLSIVQINSIATPSGTVVTLANGSVTRNADSTLTFTPTNGYQGTFTFTYIASDGSLQASPATITMTVGSSTGESGFATTFDALYDSAFQLNSNSEVLQRQVVPNPIGKSTSLTDVKYTDPAFGTKTFIVAAVTDFSDSENPPYIRNPYSKAHYWNCDGTRLLLMATNAWWHLYDTATFSHITVPGSGANGRLLITGGDNADITWDKEDPDVFYYASAQKGGLSFRQMNVVTGQTSEAWTFVGRLPPGFENATKFTTGGEGRCSEDGKRWVFMATNNAEALIGFVCYDRDLDAIVDYAVCLNKPDWVGMSPTGNYVVIAWSKGTSGLTMPMAQARGMDTADGTRAYPWGGLTGSVWTQLDTVGQHGDVALDWEGMDCWVSVSYSPYMDVGGTNGDADGGVYYRRMDDGIPHVFNNHRAYWPGQSGAAMHLSGCATKRRGWAVVSYNNSNDPVLVDRDGCIVVMELVPTNQRVYRIAHHRSYGSNYFFNAFPVPNQDLTQILFSTDFQGTVSSIRQHLIGLPSWAFPTAGAASPVTETLPTLSGAFNSGGELARANGTYSGVPAPTVSGIWQQSSDGGVTWVDIAGQTGANYTVALADGTRISWRDRVVNTGGLLYTRSPVVVVGALALPSNVSAPSTVNTTGYAETPMTTVAGVWNGNPIPVITRVWQRDISSVWTDSAFTELNASLTPDGTWRLKETATNNQGAPVVVYSNTVALNPAPIFPTPTVVYPMTGSLRTLASDNAAWQGTATSDYMVSSAGIEPNGGWVSDVVRLELGGGNSQGLEATLDINTGLSTRGDCFLNFHLNMTDAQTGYNLNVTNTQVRLYKNATQLIEGGTAHNVNTATTAMVIAFTNFMGQISVVINGVEVLAFDDSAAPLLGGYLGHGSYASGVPARTRVTSLKYSPAQ